MSVTSGTARQHERRRPTCKRNVCVFGLMGPVATSPYGTSWPSVGGVVPRTRATQYRGATGDSRSGRNRALRRNTNMPSSSGSDGVPYLWLARTHAGVGRG